MGKRLVIIDGKSVFYRGYYAMPNLSTKDGTPTGGVYGFAVMALEVLKKFKPDYVCVAWDKPKTNIRRRRELYPAYKANRTAAPPDFYEQVPVLHKLLEAFGWPMYEIDDHEADDIMGTFAVQARKKGIETVLITSDHDVLQLVNEDVKVAALKKGLTNVELYGPDSFRAKYQMTPEQFVDFKSLKGDSSDNIPGVPGIGDKTALALIEQFGSLDGVYEHLDELKGGVKKKLEDGRDMAYLTKQLVCLDLDVPLQLDWEQARTDDTDPEAIRKILTDLEFRSLLKQLPESMQGDVADEIVFKGSNFTVTAKNTVINTDAKLNKLKLTADRLLLHAWCGGRQGADLRYLIISDSVDRCYTLVLSGLTPAVLDTLLARILTAELVGYDIKGIYQALYRRGFKPGPVGHDVRMGAFLINPLIREQALTKLASETLGYEGPDLDSMPPEDVPDQAAAIISVVWALYEAQLASLKTTPTLAALARDIEWPCIPVLARMELEGIRLDVNYLERMSEELAGQISDIEQTIYGHAGEEFNIASPSQLATILFEKLALPTLGVKKGKTGYSTAANELDRLRGLHPIIDCITQYREYTKLKSTYVDALPKLVDEEGKLHTTFSTAVAATGRLSSHDPNLQNIPIRTELGKQIRTAFTAAPGNVFVSADYSQFELRLAAVLAGDDELIETFNDGTDVHTRTAAQVYGVPTEDVTKDMRRNAKVINFGILYGMSPHGLSVATGMNLADSRKFIDRYFALRQPLLEYVELTRQQALDQGYVETMFGRRRPTPDVKSSNYAVREAAYRAAINMPIQGTEADLMKIAMIKLDEQLPEDTKQILQIHDSILVETPEAKADEIGKQMKDIMENIYKLPVNLDVDVSVGKNWGEL